MVINRGRNKVMVWSEVSGLSIEDGNVRRMVHDRYGVKDEDDGDGLSITPPLNT
jgi:hypothetical protein